MIAHTLRQALRAIEQGETFAIVSVITTEGSAPGKPGHKMIVYADGRQEGTVGGGSVEAEAHQAARDMIARRQGGWLTYSLDPEAREGIGSYCGGKITLAVEVIASSVRLLLCGGGHVSQAFARQCEWLGYPYTVVDERAELVTSEHFPGATERHVGSPQSFVEEVELARFTHILVFTHHHELDQQVLFAAARARFSGYLGMIASRRKWAKIKAGLSEAGVDPEWIATIHAPVGLAIGAQTPAEIAVAMIAEIIQEGRSA